LGFKHVLLLPSHDLLTARDRGVSNSCFGTVRAQILIMVRQIDTQSFPATHEHVELEFYTHYWETAAMPAIIGRG